MTSGPATHAEATLGDAMSAGTYDVQLSYGCDGEKFAFVLNGMVGTSEHDQRNPVFGKKQEDDRYGASAIVFYKKPFGRQPLGIERWSVFASAGYSLADSNIDFCTSEVLTTAAGRMIPFQARRA